MIDSGSVMKFRRIKKGKEAFMEASKDPVDKESIKSVIKLYELGIEGMIEFINLNYPNILIDDVEKDFLINAIKISFQKLESLNHNTAQIERRKKELRKYEEAEAKKFDTYQVGLTPNLSRIIARSIRVQKLKTMAYSLSTPDLPNTFDTPDLSNSLAKSFSKITLNKKNIDFSKIAGYSDIKQVLKESIIFPISNPLLFRALNAISKTILLFGPSGNGKTMLAEATINEAGCSHFRLNSSVLLFDDNSQKLVKQVFERARREQPSIIFMDDLDSLLLQRKTNESQLSRNLKLDILAEIDNVVGKEKNQVYIIGVSNRPFDIDIAALRRFPVRKLVKTPDLETRVLLLQEELRSVQNSISKLQVENLAAGTEGFCASDLKALVKNASICALSEMASKFKKDEEILDLNEEEIRILFYKDFFGTDLQLKLGPTPCNLEGFENWNKNYGSC